VEQPGDITYDDGAITGTLTIPTDDEITISFIVRADVPDTPGQTTNVTNKACVYPGSSEDECTWSNTVTNEVFRPYEVYLPLVLR
jgi:hypothetical protein